jgi:hypothetical protein
MFEAELKEFLAAGYVLVGRIGNLDGYELRARTDDEVERIDNEGWVQLIGARNTQRVLVRIEEPNASPRLLVLTREDALSPSLTVHIGGLYLGGRFRVAEEITRTEDVDARWHASMLKTCWVSDPARTCC